MNVFNLSKELREDTYPGRGVVIERSANGTRVVAAYFIMGRSENSKNRIFMREGEGIHTQASDEAKLSDPSLIIYAPVRALGNKTIMTNGDQSDTIYEGVNRQLTFEQSLHSKEFEPDAPNYAPQISGIIHLENEKFHYTMPILKDSNGNGNACNRYTFAYEIPMAGEGHFIHTYMYGGNPLPSFERKPKLVGVPGAIDEFMALLWEGPNEEDRVSLFVRFMGIESGTYETRITNKNQ